jgi:hypothetical protein
MKDKLDGIISDIHEVKINIVKLESNYEKSIEILDRLTLSVEHHIKRTDELQDIVTKLSTQQELADLRIDNEVGKVKLVIMVLGTLGATLLFLKELGILDKLI